MSPFYIRFILSNNNRQEGVPRTFKEICAVSKISKKEIGRCFKLILKALETSVDIITTADFMSRFCSNLGKDYCGLSRNKVTCLTNEYFVFRITDDGTASGIAYRS